MKSYQVILICTMSLGCANDNSGISSDAQLTDISGTYTTALTVQQNACGILVESVGDSRSGISMVITQTDAHATADVRGLAGTAMSPWLAPRPAQTGAAPTRSMPTWSEALRAIPFRARSSTPTPPTRPRIAAHATHAKTSNCSADPVRRRRSIVGKRHAAVSIATQALHREAD